jgi:hypothetical protein
VAHELLTWTRKLVSEYNLAESTKVLISVFANVTRLAPILVQHKIIPKPDILHDFINGFNAAGELIAFVNVGHGKELSDSKITGTQTIVDKN